MSQIVAEPRQHHTDSVRLICTPRLDPDQLVHHLARQVHHPQRVLPSGVLGSWVDVVSGAKLSVTTQSVKLGRVNDCLTHSGDLDIAMDIVMDDCPLHVLFFSFTEE